MQLGKLISNLLQNSGVLAMEFRLCIRMESLFSCSFGLQLVYDESINCPNDLIRYPICCSSKSKLGNFHHVDTSFKQL